MSKRLLSISDLKGAMAWYAVVQHPYGRPLGLFDVLDEMTTLAANWQHGMCWFSREQVYPWLRQLQGLELSQRVLVEWNTPKIDNGAEVVFCSRYDGPAPERDFIDIDALLRNVSKAAWDNAEEFERAS